MTIEATFVRTEDDGTATYHITLSDPAHLAQTIVSEIVTFNNEIVLAEPIRTSDEN